MIYDDKAKQFVDGLRAGIKGTVYEPAGLWILAQWIYESPMGRNACNWLYL